VKYPTFDFLANIRSVDDASQMFSVIVGCIDQIYEGDTVHEAENYTRKELEDFVMSLGMKELSNMKDFFQEMPKVYVDVSYKRKDGTTKTSRVEGIQSFFD